MNRFLCTLVPVLLLSIISDSSAQTEKSASLAKRLQAEPVAQLVNDAVKFGDAQRGAIAFYQPAMNCARCHEATLGGRRLGPQLSEKRIVDPSHLIESVLNPSAKINEGFETMKVLLADGRLVSGILASETDERLFLDQIEQPDKPLEILKDDADDWSKTKTSTMPVDLVNQLVDRQQFLDLIAYLTEIAANGPGRASELRPAGSIALAPLPEYEERIDHAGLLTSLDASSFARGQETYRLRCASCHGTVDEEGSMPTSLRFATGKFKHGSQPFTMYNTLTHGFGMMNPQRWMVPQQKYEVIHFIREHFLKDHNPSEYFEITDDYLASLPAGNTRGPKPVVSTPWTLMDYGPSLNNTIEVSKDGSNIAQKGIAVRLDAGPGGVESGSHWMMYEHDTMRMAGAWSGKFIDWEGIHFNGTHGRHPKIAGELHVANPTGPGWANPDRSNRDSLTQRFEDDRVVGRDGKHYGPLPSAWAKYLGMYRFGKQTILKYRVADTEILESPGLEFVGGQPIYQRRFEIGRRDRDLTIQIAKHKGPLKKGASSENIAVVFPEGNKGELDSPKNISSRGLVFDGNNFAEIQTAKQFELARQDYSILVRLKTRQDGTILAKTRKQDQWLAQGKTFFLRGGRPSLDVGWVGAVTANRSVNDGEWHDVALTWNAKANRADFFIDGKPAGGGTLGRVEPLKNAVIRFGFTNDNFPSKSALQGEIQSLRFYQRRLSAEELLNQDTIKPRKLVGTWLKQGGSEFPEASGQKELSAIVMGAAEKIAPANGILVGTSLSEALWQSDDDGNIRLTIPAGEPTQFVVTQAPLSAMEQVAEIEGKLSDIQKPVNLTALTRGGPANYPEKLMAPVLRGDDASPFAVDVFQRPTNNPWNCQLRLTGLDFLPDGDTVIVAAWDGSVWRVTGLDALAKPGSKQQLQWQRIASGLFQPLGVKYLNQKIYVTCRDQIVILHDLNGDHEADWYENFNSDHQVTEHFHEFAMGLQADEAGNFYYAKSARHAKKAVVPHHGTLLKISPDGATTEIIANGFRAANGVCLNPDGSFVVTDQEGHWNPKNRINWVKPGQFYGNMFGYHDVTDSSDEAMSDPLCWITNSFDRSPSELLWVDSDQWGPLNGALLNFSYGYGKIYVVPHEEVDGQMQGGMCEFPISQFPTGVMRGRFSPDDGQLYCCGMFAWAGSQHQPGGFYRVRYTGKPLHLPIGLNATRSGVKIRLSGAVDSESATDVSNYSINTWDLKRTANYGSKHYNEKRLAVKSATLSDDGTTVFLEIPDLPLTWGMEINYALKSTDGKPVRGKIHNSIYKFGDGE
ncbi:MAG: DUF6797 domain-containing protein [Mariniblastus sp.]